MATLLSAIETSARLKLQESAASFWTSAELVDLMNDAIKDLWRSIIDLHEEHFWTNDATNVSLAASTATVTLGSVTDIFRVVSLEPRDLTTSGSGRNISFVPLDYNDPRFQEARAQTAVDPTSAGVVFYAITSAGAPVGAPVINVAPLLSSALNLRLVYIPVIAALTASGTNPIPGESDMALKAWTVAYARAKERDDKSPDPNWLAIYSTEKQSILKALSPRQEQEPLVVQGIWDGNWTN